MSIEQLEAALNDDISMQEYWQHETGSVPHCFGQLRSDILALIATKEKEAHSKGYDEAMLAKETLIRSQIESKYREPSTPRPLTLADWQRAMENPEVLKTFVRRDGKPHDYIRVLCVDAPHEYPVIVLANNGEGFNHAIDGRVPGAGFFDLLLPPRKLVRKTVYFEPYHWIFTDGTDKPSKEFGVPVTIEYEP